MHLTLPLSIIPSARYSHLVSSEKSQQGDVLVGFSVGKINKKVITCDHSLTA